MHYVYVLHSGETKNFYVGYTSNLTNRLFLHNKGLVRSTAPFIPWKLVYYSAFTTSMQAKHFERYLKTGSGKAFMYKRLVHSEALKKDKRKSSI